MIILNREEQIRFILEAATITTALVSDVMPCSLVERYHFPENPLLLYLL